ncbi:MAG: alpha/beta hydrolase [Verrucomicrobia bacterium]|nr:alpha/beta hydrolase [Verrucomicrobiota bacterium]
MNDTLQLRLHGDATLPTLVYLPGVHGDWTLVSSFRAAVLGRVRFVEFTYPRTLTWSLEDYAAAIEQALLAHGVTRGWLLAESYGSQIAWPLSRDAAADPRRFQVDGLILAGGFVRHPTIWAVRLARAFCGALSMKWLNRWLVVYARYARFRHRHAPETLASIGEFVARRTELDCRAMLHRLRLIAENDPRPIAREARLPVFFLAGLVDPIVPWVFVRCWLRRHCPAYRGGKTIWDADHNVLGTAPRPCAKRVLAWMAGEAGSDATTGKGGFVDSLHG